jgi:hypothetical protein
MPNKGITERFYFAACMQIWSAANHIGYLILALKICDPLSFKSLCVEENVYSEAQDSLRYVCCDCRR